MKKIIKIVAYIFLIIGFFNINDVEAKEKEKEETLVTCRYTFPGDEKNNWVEVELEIYKKKNKLQSMVWFSDQETHLNIVINNGRVQYDEPANWYSDIDNSEFSLNEDLNEKYKKNNSVNDLYCPKNAMYVIGTDDVTKSFYFTNNNPEAYKNQLIDSFKSYGKEPNKILIVPFKEKIVGSFTSSANLLKEANELEQLIEEFVNSNCQGDNASNMDCVAKKTAVLSKITAAENTINQAKENEDYNSEGYKELLKQLAKGKKLIEKIKNNSLTIKDLVELDDWEQTCEYIFGKKKDGKYIKGEIGYYIQSIFNYFKYGAPLILIIMSMFDYAKAIMSSDAEILKKTNSKFVKRSIATVLLFLLPTLLEFLMSLIDGFYGTCDIK